MKKEQDDLGRTTNATAPPALVPVASAISPPICRSSASLTVAQLEDTGKPVTASTSSDVSLKKWWSQEKDVVGDSGLSSSADDPDEYTHMLGALLEELVKGHSTRTIPNAETGRIDRDVVKIEGHCDDDEEEGMKPIKMIVSTADTSGMKGEISHNKDPDNDDDDEEEELRLLFDTTASSHLPHSSPIHQPAADRGGEGMPATGVRCEADNSDTSGVDSTTVLAMKGVFFNSIRSMLFLRTTTTSTTALETNRRETANPRGIPSGDMVTPTVECAEMRPDGFASIFLSSMETALHSYQSASRETDLARSGVDSSALLRGYFRQCVEPLLACASLSTVNELLSSGNGGGGGMSSRTTGIRTTDTTPASAPTPPSSSLESPQITQVLLDNSRWTKRLFHRFYRLLYTALLDEKESTNTALLSSSSSKNSSASNIEASESASCTKNLAFRRMIRLALTWGELCHTTRLLRGAPLSDPSSPPSPRASESEDKTTSPTSFAPGAEYSLSHPSFWMLCTGACGIITAYVLRLVRTLEQYGVSSSSWGEWDPMSHRRRTSDTIVPPLLDELWIVLSVFTSRFASTAMLRGADKKEGRDSSVTVGCSPAASSAMMESPTRPEEAAEDFLFHARRCFHRRIQTIMREEEGRRPMEAEGGGPEKSREEEQESETEKAKRVANRQWEAMVRDAFPALCSALEQHDQEIDALTRQMNGLSVATAAHFGFPDVGKLRQKKAVDRENIASALLSAAVLDTHTAEPIWWVMRSFVLQLRVEFARWAPSPQKNGGDDDAAHVEQDCDGTNQGQSPSSPSCCPTMMPSLHCPGAILNEMRLAEHHHLLQEVLSRFLLGIERRLDRFQRHQQTLLPMALAAVQEELERASSGSRPFFPLSPPVSRSKSGPPPSPSSSPRARRNAVSVVCERASELIRQLYHPAFLSEALVWEDVVRMRNMSANRSLWWNRMVLQSLLCPRMTASSFSSSHSASPPPPPPPPPPRGKTAGECQTSKTLPGGGDRDEDGGATAASDEQEGSASITSSLIPVEGDSTSRADNHSHNRRLVEAVTHDPDPSLCTKTINTPLLCPPPHLEHHLSKFWTTLDARVHALTVLQVTQEAPETALPSTIGEGKIGGRGVMGFAAPRARLRQAWEATRTTTGSSSAGSSLVASYVRGLPPFHPQALAIALHTALEASSRHLALVESAAGEGVMQYLSMTASAAGDSQKTSTMSSSSACITAIPLIRKRQECLLHCLGDEWNALDCFAAAAADYTKKQRGTAPAASARLPAPLPLLSPSSASSSSSSTSHVILHLTPHRRFLASFFYLTYHPTCYAVLSQYRRNPHQRHLLKALQQLARLLLPSTQLSNIDDAAVMDSANNQEDVLSPAVMEEDWVRLVHGHFTLLYEQERIHRQHSAVASPADGEEGSGTVTTTATTPHRMSTSRQGGDTWGEEEDDDWWDLEDHEDSLSDNADEEEHGGSGSVHHHYKKEKDVHNDTIAEVEKKKKEEAVVLFYTPKTAATVAAGQDMYLHMFLYHTFLSLLPYAEFSFGTGAAGSGAVGGVGSAGPLCGWVSFVERSLQDKNISPSTQCRIEMMDQLVVPLLLRLSTPIPELLQCLSLRAAPAHHTEEDGDLATLTTTTASKEDKREEEMAVSLRTLDTPPAFTSTFLLLCLRAAGLFQLPWSAGGTLLVLHRFQRLCQHLLHQEQVHSHTKTSAPTHTWHYFADEATAGDSSLRDLKRTAVPVGGGGADVVRDQFTLGKGDTDKTSWGREKERENGEEEGEEQLVFLSRRKRCRAMREAWCGASGGDPASKRLAVEPEEPNAALFSEPLFMYQRWTLTVEQQHAVLERLRGLVRSSASSRAHVNTNNTNSNNNNNNNNNEEEEEKNTTAMDSYPSIPPEERLDEALLHEIDRENANEQPLLRVALQQQQQQQQQQKSHEAMSQGCQEVSNTQDSSMSGGSTNAREDQKTLEHAWGTLDGGGNPSTHWLLEGAALLHHAVGTTCIPPAPCGALMVMSSYYTISAVLHRRRAEWMEACARQREEEEMGELGGGGGYGYGGGGRSGLLSGPAGGDGSSGGGGNRSGGASGAVVGSAVSLPPFCSPEDVTVLLLHVRALHRMLFTFNVQSFQPFSAFLREGEEVGVEEDVEQRHSPSSQAGARSVKDGRVLNLLWEALRQGRHNSEHTFVKGSVVPSGGGGFNESANNDTLVFLEDNFTTNLLRFYMQSGIEKESSNATGRHRSAEEEEAEGKGEEEEEAADPATSFSLFQFWLSYLHHLCDVVLPPASDADWERLSALPPSQRPSRIPTMLSSRVFCDEADAAETQTEKVAPPASTSSHSSEVAGAADVKKEENEEQQQPFSSATQPLCAKCEGWRTVCWPIHGAGGGGGGSGSSDWWASMDPKAGSSRIRTPTSSFSTDLSTPTQLRILIAEALADLVVAGLEELQDSQPTPTTTASTPLLFPPPPPSCFPSTSYLLHGSRPATDTIVTSAASFRQHHLRLYQRGARATHASHAVRAPEYVVVEDVKVEAVTSAQQRWRRRHPCCDEMNAASEEDEDDSEDEKEWEHAQRQTLLACQFIPRQVLLGLCESLQLRVTPLSADAPAMPNEASPVAPHAERRIPLYMSASGSSFPSPHPTSRLSRLSSHAAGGSWMGPSPSHGEGFSASGHRRRRPPLLSMTYAQAKECCWLGLHGLVAFCRRIESRVVSGCVEDAVIGACLSQLWQMADVLALGNEGDHSGRRGG